MRSFRNVYHNRITTQFKHFVCTPDELTNVLAIRDINELLDFWSFVQLQIIPNFSALAYPLEDADTFQTRPCILTALRDKVLLPILRNHELSNEDRMRIRPILALVCFVTADHSQKHQEFVELSDRILFNNVSLSTQNSLQAVKVSSQFFTILMTSLSQHKSRKSSRLDIHFQLRTSPEYHPIFELPKLQSTRLQSLVKKHYLKPSVG